MPVKEGGKKDAGEKKGTDVSDKEGLAKIVCEALADIEGYGVWGRLRPAEDVHVRDVSGHGGSKTFIAHAQVDGISAAAVVLHVRPDDCSSFMMRRTEAAQAALSAAGLGPRRLAGGADWWVETYVGPEIKREEKGEKPKGKKAGGKKAGGKKAEKKETEEEAKLREAKDRVRQQRRGALLARVHGVSTSWFKLFQDELRAHDPRLQKTPDSSLLWLYLTRGCFGAAREADDRESFFTRSNLSSDKWSAETLNRYGDLTPFQSRIPFCNRIVLLHGDYHDGNVLKHPDGTDDAGGGWSV